MNKQQFRPWFDLRLFINALIVLSLALGLAAAPGQPSLAANPAAQQIYYNSLPEDDLLDLFDTDDVDGGTFPDPISPIRSITSIAIASTGTLVYWDQWEDGSYDADIANPGGNIYANPGNLDGTQIWGDGVLANGCPPSINNVPNACLVAADDQLAAGDVIILDNDVAVEPYGLYVLDQFSAVAYDNNGGNRNWANSWDETSDDDNPASGTILITSNQLRFSTAAAGDEIEREVNLLSYEIVRLSFTLGGSGLETDGSDELRVQMSSNGGGTWTTLQTFNGASTATTYTYDISAYAAANTRVGFYQVDTTEASEYYYIDDVRIEWGYKRNPAQVFYDGRDKFGVTFPVAATRGAFPVSPGSVMAGGNEVLDTTRWGTSYEAPLGQDTSDSNTNAFEDVRWFIMAGPGGATIDVDANGDGDLADADDLNDYVLAEGGKLQVDDILMGGTLAVVAGNPVQVNSMTADVDDTFEFRWDALLPRSAWSNNYLTPVGTNPKASNSGCTEVEVYNPNASTITINYDFPGGASPDGNFTVTAGNTATGQTSPATPLVPYNNGGRYWSQGGEPFLPISVTDCTRDTSGTDGRLYDWGNPLFPVDQLTNDVLVGWAPGCSNESSLGICDDADITNKFSRNVVWVTPLANTNIYIDTNGSGITCSGGAYVSGAEQFITPANALVSYRIDDDPSAANTVRDDFGSTSYSNNNGTQNWSTSWDETGDNDLVGSGSILITSGTLRITDSGTEAGDTIEREANLSGQVFADLTFRLTSSGALETDDELAVDISTDGGSTWRTLATYKDDPTTAVKAIIISPYIASNTRIRFRQVNNLDAGDYWNIDEVQIKYAANGDYDMTAARIVTCDGTAFAAAWGQDPELTSSNDEEALDLGTGITPLGSRLTIDKTADKTEVAVGGPVVYTYEVNNLGNLPLGGVTVTDNKCSPTVYSSGDTNSNNLLDPTETWEFTCTTNIFIDTTNVAYASSTTPARVSAPDEWTVTVIQPAVIGNYVWLDEDGDGDQDAGEAGIPNVLVTLTGKDEDGNDITLTTYTDANGGYLFDGLPPSDANGYTITVTPPANLNQTYDENGLGTPNATTVVVEAGDEYLTADFGYNWNTTNETNTGNGNGAIGDRVWIDADGDGEQDPGEAGLGGVTVNLYSDPDNDGVYDTLAGTTITDASGNYIFDNLPPGSYVVDVVPPAGYTQTGDPDGSLDNQTTSPVVLGPGDVYVNADFGYQPQGDSSDIGDTVYFDANGDGTYDPGEGEYGIAGVTVALILDDGDGVYEPGIDKIIATDITDENGVYLFPGLPGGTYFVMVTDTENVLGELAPVNDADGGKDEISKVTVNGIVDNLDQDFGYSPPGHEAGEGMIGDTIWLDRNGNNQFDPGEGLEGVKVTLTDPGFDGVFGTADDTTRVTNTDENGNYSFGNLEPSLSYQVTVDTSTLPAGVTNTVDPDGTTDNTTVRNLAVTGPIDLGADFAYRDQTNPNSISGTIWKDTDADGTLEGGEAGRFAGVTVVLKDSDGNIVATTTTDSSGNYSFSNLPDGTYTVDVTDDNNVLNGYWKSTGPSAGSDNNSQVDPYTVTVSGGQNNTTADFGYYREPAALGDFVWEDLDGDGIQDAGEPGIPGVVVTLTITWPGGAGTTTLATITAADGSYSFDNLLLDEDFDGVGAGEPTFSISVATPPGYAETQRDQGGNDALDSDNASGQAATATQGAVNNTYDFGFVRLGAVGNYIWLDEDGDGDQDAGEAGIPNVKVTLTGTALNGAPVNLTTYTDANGGYLFANVPPGNYTVTVDQTTLPSGLAANPTYDENGTGTPHTSSVTLLPGQEYLTADFGYNWSTPTETNTNTGTGAIGDRVWSDADGDGMQDPEEVGIAGVTVQLYTAGPDGIFGTGDDVLSATTTTDANGNYIFDNLPAGAYQVIVTPPTGYTQTGDPDSSLDNKTTSPIVLSPGDVYVNADFGYQATTAEVGDIGDTLWLDADRDNTLDAGETLLAGVTVSLIKDSNGNGVWDPGEPIIATDTTDANGQYLFSGVPAGAGQDYLVWVNDTENVLGGLVPTYDSNGVGTPNLSAVTNLTLAGDLNQDFAYAPPGHDAGEGIIGDTIFLDRDNSGTPGTGEGLEGVKVQLYDSTGTTLLATTYTDENGNYTFGGLPAATYVVKVDPATLPAGVTNTTDPDGGTANQSTVVLPSGGVNLAQDFGYRDTSNPNSISGTIWKDTDADGTLEGGEAGRFAGVTVVLKDSDGNIVATTTTDSSGNYSFSNLPDGTYTVDVTDDNNVLNGYWKSTGPSAGSDNNSQVDPYTVTVSGGQNNTTADFGYYREPAVISNFVWYDSDKDGIQDDGEAGIIGVEVTLEITYPDGTVVTLKTETNANGEYSFGNLLLDEDFDGVGTSATPGVGGGNEPAFVVKVTVPTGMEASDPNQGGDPTKDSDYDPSGVQVYPLQGKLDDTIDFGFNPGPTAVTLAAFSAEVDGQQVRLSWETLMEVNVTGFNVYRSVQADGSDRQMLNLALIPSQFNPGQGGAIYEYYDATVQTDVLYYYWLEVVVSNGSTEMHGPQSVVIFGTSSRIYLPMLTR